MSIAEQLPGQPGLALLTSARNPFVQGLHIAAAISAAVAIGAAIMVVILLRCVPASSPRETPPDWGAATATAKGEKTHTAESMGQRSTG